MKNLIHYLTLLLVLANTPFAISQINDAEKNVVIVSGLEHIDQISSRFQPSISLVENCFVNITSTGNQTYKVTISPKQSNTNYAGSAKAIIQYTDGLPPKPRYISYNVSFVASKITTQPDFVTLTSDNEVKVSPLQNDNTTSSGLKLNGIGVAQGGEARISNNDVFYTPNAGPDNGYVLYGVKDNKGSSSNGMIYFVKEKKSFSAIDTIKFSLLNTQSKLIFLPASGFNPVTTPTKGQISKLHALAFNYTPTKGSSGNDIFSFTDGTGNKRIVVVQLISKVQNTTSVRDDKVYTPKNTAITFDVFSNDLSSNFPISAFSSGLTKLSGGKFTYIPPPGFSGIKNFTYTVNYGYYTSTGKITITVGNYAPQTTLDYNFNTLKNNVLAITYDVPVTGYSFKVLNQPHYGGVEIFDQNTTIRDDCNDIRSKATLIYSPDNNYYGADSFDLEYCIDNNPCIVYKIYIKIHDHNLKACPCQGADCVWQGDMNGDGRVSVSDLLSLGRFIGLSGSGRQDILLPYPGGQRSDDWQYSQPNGLNIKHIDSNGDGILSIEDTMAIAQNYGSVHSFVPDEVLAIKDYNFELIPNATRLDSGDLLVLDVVIGSQSRPVVDMFGLAFGLNFSPSLFARGTLNGYFYKDSWFTGDGPSLQMVKQPQEGILHAGVVKAGAVVTDEADGFKPTGASGNGIIGKIYAVVTDEADGFRSNARTITRRISTEGIEIEDIDGEKFKVPDAFIDIDINLDKKVPVPTEDKLIVYPNPAKEAVQLHFNGKNIIKGYKMYDAMGSIVGAVSELNQQKVSVNTSELPSGIYVVQVVTTQGTISKKIKILNK
jgi:hypothetical protein